MRVWDINPKLLCRKHLLGEHRELHAIWVILTENKKGYRSHPETKRWEGKLKALFARHEDLVSEMKCRSFRHRSNLDVAKATGRAVQDKLINTIEEQISILKNKPCDCFK